MAWQSYDFPSGKTVRMRRLRPYELDKSVKFVDPGPYMLQALRADGTVKEWPYDYNSPPDKPTVPEKDAQPGTVDFVMWEMWHQWEAAVLHHSQRMDYFDKYAHRVTDYVFEECVHPEDQDLLDIEDLDFMNRTCACPELKEGDLEVALSEVFPGFDRWGLDTELSALLEDGKVPSFHHVDTAVGESDEGSLEHTS